MESMSTTPLYMGKVEDLFIFRFEMLFLDWRILKLA